MPDVGAIVTNDEVTNFVSGIDTITDGSVEEIMVLAAEGLVEDYCQRSFSTQVHTDEEYDIPNELKIHNVVIRPYNELSLRDYPVDLSETFEIKFVTARDETTGLPSNTTLIKRNSYVVDNEVGLVRVLANTLDVLTFPQLPRANSVFSFPEGFAEILVTYTSGFTAVNMPRNLKLAVLIAVARLHRLQQKGQWDVKLVTTEFGVTNLIRDMLTPEELILLKQFKRPILV